jgi:hypothetical protein
MTSGNEPESPDGSDVRTSGSDAGAAGKEPPPPASVFQMFERMHVEHGHFGSSTTPAPEHRATGPLEETEIAKIVSAYAEPACFCDAASALATEHVIVLSGPAGSGRRAGSITLLDRIRAPGGRLVALSPAITVEKLAARSFDEGVSYLVNDMFDDQFIPEVADFHWLNICRNIRKSKACLVVTVGSGSPIARSKGVEHFSWHRPEIDDVLRAHLGETVIDDKIIDTVAKALGPGYPLSEIAAIVHKISTATDIDEVLADIQGASRLAVANWLDDAEREIPAVLEVAALAFVVGVSERIFEAELLELKARMAEFTPEQETKSAEARAQIDLRFRQLRKLRADHPLLMVQRVPMARKSGSLPIRHVDFRMPVYRVHVITELWSRVSGEFWDAIQNWLRGIAQSGHPELINSMASGLALLGLVAPDEVIDSYLNPWTADDASWDEQTTAVYVLWRMSMLSQLAPLALQIAIHWAGQGTRTQRRAATYVFSGELGARYPTEAVKRLTHLADQGEELARQAHALLFATLAEQDNDATVVLLEMRRRMSKKTDLPSAGLVSDAIADVLSIRDPRSGRPSVALFLFANPHGTADIAPLWARLLRLRPWRGRAMSALVNVIFAIEHGQPDPKILVRSLGSAIGKELPASERANMRTELFAVARGKRARHLASEDDPAGDEHNDSSTPRVSEYLLETFLAACESPFQKEVSQNHG